MNIILIDDEADARALLRGIIQSYCPDIIIIGEAEGVQSGVQLIRQLQPDVVFLDIQMEDGTGFDLLDFFPHPVFSVVFTTAHDTFALRAFRYHAVDYLLKPIAPVEFVAVIERLKLINLTGNTLRLHQLKESFKGKSIDKMAVSTAEGLSFLQLDEILRLESDGNYTTFFMLHGEKIIVSRGIKEFEDLLSAADFCRIHQSHIVHLRYVRKFLKEDGGYALMSTGDKVPVSRRKKDEFLELLFGQLK